MIDSGVDGLCVLANYSEQFLLADEEREILTRQILQCVDGRVPVIVTTSHFSSTVCVERSRRAQDMGAAMVMVMPPYHGATFRVGEAQIHDFYATLSDALRIPIMIQDAPVAGTDVARLPGAHGPRNRAGVVFQDGNGGRGGETARAHPAGRRGHRRPVDGEEGITLLADLDAGATGSMTAATPTASGPSSTPIGRGPGPGLCAVPGLASPINHENRQAGFLAAKAPMKEGGIIRCDAPRHPWPALHPETRRGLLDIARRLDPLVLRWA